LSASELAKSSVGAEMLRRLGKDVKLSHDHSQTQKRPQLAFFGSQELEALLHELKTLKAEEVIRLSASSHKLGGSLEISREVPQALGSSRGLRDAGLRDARRTSTADSEDLSQSTELPLSSSVSLTSSTSLRSSMQKKAGLLRKPLTRLEKLRKDLNLAQKELSDNIPRDIHEAEKLANLDM
jgi:hypothetical protein